MALSLVSPAPPLLKLTDAFRSHTNDDTAGAFEQVDLIATEISNGTGIHVAFSLCGSLAFGQFIYGQSDVDLAGIYLEADPEVPIASLLKSLELSKRFKEQNLRLDCNQCTLININSIKHELSLCNEKKCMTDPQSLYTLLQFYTSSVFQSVLIGDIDAYKSIEQLLHVAEVHNHKLQRMKERVAQQSPYVLYNGESIKNWEKRLELYTRRVLESQPEPEKFVINAELSEYSKDFIDSLRMIEGTLKTIH